MHLLLRWIGSAVALYVTVYAGRALGLRLWIEPGLQGVVAALVTALLLGVVNAVVRPIVKFLTLPLTCLTLGLFSFVINAALFWIVGQFVYGFHVSGFLAALFGSVVMSIVGGLLNTFLISATERDR
jgi:putative membrane protein